MVLDNPVQSLILCFRDTPRLTIRIGNLRFWGVGPWTRRGKLRQKNAVFRGKRRNNNILKVPNFYCRDILLSLRRLLLCGLLRWFFRSQRLKAQRRSGVKALHHWHDCPLGEGCWVRGHTQGALALDCLLFWEARCETTKEEMLVKPGMTCPVSPYPLNLRGWQFLPPKFRGGGPLENTVKQGVSDTPPPKLRGWT